MSPETEKQRRHGQYHRPDLDRFSLHNDNAEETHHQNSRDERERIASSARAAPSWAAVEVDPEPHQHREHDRHGRGLDRPCSFLREKNHPTVIGQSRECPEARGPRRRLEPIALASRRREVLRKSAQHARTDRHGGL